MHYAYKPEHPWLKEDGDASDRPISSAVLIRMKQFRAMNKMKKLALKVWFDTISYRFLSYSELDIQIVTWMSCYVLKRCPEWLQVSSLTNYYMSQGNKLTQFTNVAFGDRNAAFKMESSKDYSWKLILEWKIDYVIFFLKKFSILVRPMVFVQVLYR